MKEYKRVKYLSTTRAGSAFELLSGDKLLEDAVILVEDEIEIRNGVITSVSLKLSLVSSRMFSLSFSFPVKMIIKGPRKVLELYLLEEFFRFYSLKGPLTMAFSFSSTLSVLPYTRALARTYTRFRLGDTPTIPYIALRRP